MDTRNDEILKPTPHKEGLTRREFIKKMAVVVGAATLVGTIANAPDTKHSTTPDVRQSAELPQDILSEKELRESHIRIVQTPTTQLYLRRAALEEAHIFRDAKEGKLDEVVIVLTEKTTWKASEDWPEDVKKLYRATQEKNVSLSLHTTILLDDTARKFWTDHKEEILFGNFNWEQQIQNAQNQDEKDRLLQMEHSFANVLYEEYGSGQFITADKYYQREIPEFFRDHPEYLKKHTCLYL